MIVGIGASQSGVEIFSQASYIRRQRGPGMRIRIAQYPQLQHLCWNRPPNTVLAGEDALAIYERNWWHVDQDALTPEERDMLTRLIARYGNGVLNV